jgi:large subunit ribosomal protein L2
MPVKKFNPITPGTRGRVSNSYAEITSDTPEKSLLAKYSKTGGRNNEGRMTMRYRGGGHKRSYRLVDFKRTQDGIEALVKTIEYDPNRTAFIALLQFPNGSKSYILAPAGLQVGTKVMSGSGIAPEKGNCLPLGEMPLGTVIHNIELTPGQGGVLARSAGNSAVVLGRDGKYVVVKMPSGERRLILATCRATVGTVSNPDHNLQKLGKAGRKRWLGRRPRNRGVAMNPVDHPMGGGEGRASGGQPRSRRGLKAKGAKTRSPRRYSNNHILARRKSQK